MTRAPQDATAVNRAHWDELAGVHGQDAYYDTEALEAGADTLLDVESAAVGDVRGLEVMHLQSHLGFDAISLVRRGARVTAVDFSPVALARAGELARRCGVGLELVEADAQALPAGLRGRFDVVYATIGVLCWIGDVEAWMRSVAAVLRPGGRLVLVEIHPLYGAVGSVDPLVLDFPYAFDGPRRFDEPGTYASDAKVAASATVEYAHGLGEVVTAAVVAGMRVDALHEHLDAAVDVRGGVLPQDDDGRYRLLVSGQALPVLFTLLASRPA